MHINAPNCTHARTHPINSLVEVISHIWFVIAISVQGISILPLSVSV